MGYPNRKLPYHSINSKEISFFPIPKTVPKFRTGPKNLLLSFLLNYECDIVFIIYYHTTTTRLPHGYYTATTRLLHGYHTTIPLSLILKFQNHAKPHRVSRDKWKHELLYLDQISTLIFERKELEYSYPVPFSSHSHPILIFNSILFSSHSILIPFSSHTTLITYHLIYYSTFTIPLRKSLNSPILILLTLL